MDPRGNGMRKSVKVVGKLILHENCKRRDNMRQTLIKPVEYQDFWMAGKRTNAQIDEKVENIGITQKPDSRNVHLGLPG